MIPHVNSELNSLKFRDSSCLPSRAVPMPSGNECGQCSWLPGTSCQRSIEQVGVCAQWWGTLIWFLKGLKSWTLIEVYELHTGLEKIWTKRLECPFSWLFTPACVLQLSHLRHPPASLDGAQSLSCHWAAVAAHGVTLWCLDCIFCRTALLKHSGR